MTRLILLAPMTLAGCLGSVDPCRVPPIPGEPYHCVPYSEDAPTVSTASAIPDDNGGPTVDDHGPGTKDNNGGSSDNGNGSDSHD